MAVAGPRGSPAAWTFPRRWPQPAPQPRRARPLVRHPRAPVYHRSRHRYRVPRALARWDDRVAPFQRSGWAARRAPDRSSYLLCSSLALLPRFVWLIRCGRLLDGRGYTAHLLREACLLGGALARVTLAQ